MGMYEVYGGGMKVVFWIPPKYCEFDDHINHRLFANDDVYVSKRAYGYLCATFAGKSTITINVSGYSNDVAHKVQVFTNGAKYGVSFDDIEIVLG